MSYRQAFHTSCRKGLSGHAGFQFNAASGDLDQEQLTRIAADHSGYRPAPDAPPEPSPAEIAAMPIDLRYLPVEGVGPVISRTAYVGREFRGTGGEPDSGRFGNYFSHVLVGDGDEPFGGLLPIELWEAPHWSTTEAAQTELPPLDEIEPGAVDLERILGQLSPTRGGALGAIGDAALRAVLGGPRLVIVEADADLAATWVAWASFALPADRIGGMTFATFEGRPRVAESVRLCVTTPGCDVDFPPYELGSSVVVIDTAAPPPPGELSLYGRVLDRLAREGAEAVAVAVRELPAELDLAAAGAHLAVAARCTDIALPGDLPSVLVALRGRLGTVPIAAAAELAAALPGDDGSAAAFSGWAELYAAARRSDDPDATALVDTALERMLDSLGDPPADLPSVDSDSAAVPSAGVLARWLGSVSSAAGTARLGPLLSAGARLGLIGCNTALDKELIAPTAADFADPAVQAAYGELARAGGSRLVEGVALELAAEAGGGRGLDLLRRAASEPLAYEAVRAKAAEGGDFESVAAWELLRAASGESDRLAAVTALAGLARSAAHEAAIRALYGEDGPDGPAEHAELLTGWERAGGEPPMVDYERALACLAELSFGDAERAGRLFGILRKGPRPVRGDPEFIAWSLLFEAAPDRQEFRDWAAALSRLRRRPDARLSRSREEQLASLAARVAVQCLDEPDHPQGVGILLDALGGEWAEQLGDALARRAGKSINPQKLFGRAFVTWHKPKRCQEALLEVALPRATGDLSARELDDVGASLGERGLPAWEAWLEDHPPRRAVSRAVRGVFRRGDDR
ncbi:MAG TPA: hypothetical protein VFM94_08585 [Solirubrobacterales bacterium]|nr:hypothetical protein [Solirubrobacterales bacterium]